jgi:urea transport system permease protein
VGESAALRLLIDALGEGSYDETEAQISALADSGDARAAPALKALAAGDLYTRKSDGKVFIAARAGKGYELRDPISGETAGEAGRREVEKIRVNNRLRRAVRAALGALTLGGGSDAQRLAAAETLFKTRDGDALEALDAALEKESSPQVRAAMEQARAAILLSDPKADETQRLAAIDTIAARGDRAALGLLRQAAAGEQGAVALKAADAASDVQQVLKFWELGQNIWYGLSLGSVLLLAAIGLSITFGVMGVINMAHGEMVMLGAYTTFTVQEVIRSTAPGLFDYSLALAIPLAFLVSGAVGIAIERSVIRWLYGRPLETLLATWGLSLILQQAIRTIYGPTNREVGNPDWMSGAFELGHLTITYNRLWIIAFALFVFAVLMLVLRHTPLGLQMRAVTQNRQMASAMGIRTPWIDALTFGLGSGIAGIAGVALSQIGNVSPNLGQSYIIDSFMVVVFGGVGNLWGTLVGAFSLGVANKFLEPFAGAVLGKILVLVLIILFIQRYPRGLFALKGRAVEA